MLIRPMQLVTLILSAIVVVGLIGIPIGDPRFFVQAIILELVFIILTILSIKKIRHVLIPNIIVGIIIIIGNTLSPQHIDIMFSLNPLENAIILLLGGYILQILLISSSIIVLKQKILN